MSATSTSRARTIPRKSLPSQILFDERDGIYWLRGEYLEQAGHLLGLRYEGVAVGFDYPTWSIYVRDLAQRKIAIGVLQGGEVRDVRIRATNRLRLPTTATIDLAPRQLFTRAELEVFTRRDPRATLPLSRSAEKLNVDLADSYQNGLRDVGSVFVYMVGDDLYEIDWDLTTVPRSVVEDFAIAAHLAGRLISCQLIPPRRRQENVPTLRSNLRIAALVPYGQLALAL
jgi:hypothetical protein